MELTAKKLQNTKLRDLMELTNIKVIIAGWKHTCLILRNANSPIQISPFTIHCWKKDATWGQVMWKQEKNSEFHGPVTVQNDIKDMF